MSLTIAQCGRPAGGFARCFKMTEGAFNYCPLVEIGWKYSHIWVWISVIMMLCHQSVVIFHMYSRFENYSASHACKFKHNRPRLKKCQFSSVNFSLIPGDLLYFIIEISWRLARLSIGTIRSKKSPPYKMFILLIWRIIAYYCSISKVLFLKDHVLAHYLDWCRSILDSISCYSVCLEIQMPSHSNVITHFLHQ